MNLPEPVQSYFAADAVIDGAVPLDAFSRNAVVLDEGGTHIGDAAITSWWRGAKARYQNTSVPHSVRQDHDRIIVRAMVTGRFPGSPALLSFAFRLSSGQIVELEIGA
ncbi:MAG: nuclear transport factor 2 family protein [Pseudomonadota bacterium]|nr:nuclear transport factor 2 family protein [Pseudomonadota bacterium]